MHSVNPSILIFNPRPGALLRLFCFHHAGGGALAFSKWSAILPEEIEVCGVQLPGRENRLNEPPYLQFALMLKDIKEALFPYCTKKFAFFGHSMGALICFESARLLRRENIHPAHLFVSGQSAPQHLSVKQSIHDLPDALFVEKLQALNGTPSAVLENPELLNFFLPRLRADFALYESYHYINEMPLDIPITAVGGLSDPEVTMTALRDWEAQTNKNFNINMFYGDHFFLQQQQTILLKYISSILSDFIIHGVQIN